MAHPFSNESQTGQERAKARYYADYAVKPKDSGSARGDAAQPPQEEWTKAPSRQVSNTGGVKE